MLLNVVTMHKVVYFILYLSHLHLLRELDLDGGHGRRHRLHLDRRVEVNVLPELMLLRETVVESALLVVVMLLLLLLLLVYLVEARVVDIR